MLKKHIPLRTCVGCRQRFDKSHLLRYALKDGNIVEDKTANSSGRGVYLCENCMSIYSSKDDSKKKNFLLKKMLHDLNKNKK